MKKILSLSLLILLSSCVSRKLYLEQKNKISILSKQLDSINYINKLDTDGDQIVDKDDKCPTVAGSKENGGCPSLDADRDNVLDKDDDCPTIAGSASNRGCPEVSSEYVMPAYALYFQQLKPTRSITINDYFKKGSLLKECNTKLTKILKERLKITDGNYKYFAINDKSYAIITKKECINKDGTAINKENCRPENSCNMFQFFCVEKGYSRFYLILVTTKTLGTPLGFKEEEFKKVYETNEIDTNWNSINEIKQLFINNKKLTEEYSILIKLFEIKKDGPMGDAQLLIDPTYDFDKQINNIFKSPTQ